MPEKFSARMVKWFDSKTFEWKGCDSSRILKVRYYRIGKLQEDSERSRCNKQSKRSKNKNSQSLHGHYAIVTVEQWPEDVASNRSIQDHPTHYFQVREECTACSSMTGSQIALPRILIPFHSIPIHESPFIGPLELRFDGPIRWSFMSLSLDTLVNFFRQIIFGKYVATRRRLAVAQLCKPSFWWTNRSLPCTRSENHNAVRLGIHSRNFILWSSYRELM